MENEWSPYPKTKPVEAGYYYARKLNSWCTAYWTGQIFKWHNLDYLREMSGVTHWMTLPKPPKGATQ